MNIKTIAATVLTACSLSACGTMMSQHKAMGDPDKMFIMDAAMASNAEVGAAKIALQRSKSPVVRKFASDMIADHTAANERLEPVAKKQGLTLPSAPDPTHVAVANHLSEVDANKFDLEYAAQMVADHAMVVSKFEHASRNASDASVRSYAAQELPALKHHYSMVQNIKSDLTK